MLCRRRRLVLLGCCRSRLELRAVAAARGWHRRGAWCSGVAVVRRWLCGQREEVVVSAWGWYLETRRTAMARVASGVVNERETRVRGGFFALGCPGKRDERTRASGGPPELTRVVLQDGASQAQLSGQG
jgi:hypothetical protein